MPEFTNHDSLPQNSSPFTTAEEDAQFWAEFNLLRPALPPLGDNTLHTLNSAHTDLRAGISEVPPHHLLNRQQRRAWDALLDRDLGSRNASAVVIDLIDRKHYRVADVSSSAVLPISSRCSFYAHWNEEAVQNFCGTALVYSVGFTGAFWVMWCLITNEWAVRQPVLGWALVLEFALAFSTALLFSAIKDTGWFHSQHRTRCRVVEEPLNLDLLQAADDAKDEGFDWLGVAFSCGSPVLVGVVGEVCFYAEGKWRLTDRESRELLKGKNNGGGVA